MKNTSFMEREQTLETKHSKQKLQQCNKYATSKCSINSRTTQSKGQLQIKWRMSHHGHMHDDVKMHMLLSCDVCLCNAVIRSF